MITSDYFLRMIHQLAQVIAKVLGLSLEKQYDAALDEVNRSSKQLLGMDLRMLTTLSDEEFVRLLTLGERFDVEKCVVLGELLRLVGEVKERGGDEGPAFRAYAASLSLFLELSIRESGVLPRQYHDEIGMLIGKVSAYELPVQLKVKLFQYYESVGEFGRSENLLFELAEKDPAFVGQGLQFYRRLQSKSDEELERGNLPRKEIDAGIQDLKKRSDKKEQIGGLTW
ncbi:MAG TPA: DUF6483 family protein [Bacteroidota bacterium]|nr:DUF6483 family protein [Bacteroidota bacterium]